MPREHRRQRWAAAVRRRTRRSRSMAVPTPTQPSKAPFPARQAPQVELQRRDTEIALAVFRTVFLLIVLTSQPFLTARGRAATLLEVAVIAAAGYNLALFVIHLRGAGLPRGVIIAVDVIMISLWLHFVGPAAPVYFVLYYTVVIVSGLWFGVLGAFLTGLASSTLYFWALLSSGGIVVGDRDALGASAVQVLFLMVTAGVVSAAMEIQSQERQALVTSRAALQQHWQRIRIAQTIDQMIRPPRLPSVAGLDIAFRYRPAAYSVSGEYYDVIRLAPRRAGICIADFAVRWEWGLQYLYAFKNVFRLAARREHSPARVLSQVNREMEAEIASEPTSQERPYAFASMCYTIIDLDAGAVSYAIAGHEPPLLFSPATGEVTALDRASGIVLNVEPEAHYEEAKAPVHTGDFLVLFTDGLIEVRDQQGGFFGRERVIACLEENRSAPNAAALADALFSAAGRFGEQGERRDDITLLVIRITAGDIGADAEERP
jgi:serine phosphatase RsbU (regulator of sigma subunit)